MGNGSKDSEKGTLLVMTSAVWKWPHECFDVSEGVAVGGLGGGVTRVKL